MLSLGMYICVQYRTKFTAITKPDLADIIYISHIAFLTFRG